MKNGDFKVTAIIAIYNEEDIIAEVVDDLIGQGIHVYILDDGSTDNSLEKLKRFCDSGLLTIEIFRPPVESSGTFFEWESILSRKEELARELDSDWFIHADADEFRESPFPGMSLAQGVRLVDRLGYNAIDFAVINFYPVEGEEIINEGIRQSFLHYEDGAEYDRLQIKCWKKQPDSVDLVTAGGHQAVFPERKVFPIRFILRHYPLRGREHARKKVFTERLPRLKNDERIKGWHVQYDKYDEQSIFVRRAEELERYEPDKVRSLLMTYNRELEALKASLESVIRDKDAHVGNLDAVIRDKGAHIGNLEAAIRDKDVHIGNLEALIRDKDVHIGNFDTHTKNIEAENAHLVTEKIRLEAESAQYLRDMHEMKHVEQQKDTRILALEKSLSWRITSPLRRLADLFFPVNSLRLLMVTMLIGMLTRPGVFLHRLSLFNIKSFFHYLRHTKSGSLTKTIHDLMGRNASDQPKIRLNAHLLRLALQVKPKTSNTPRTEPLDIILPVYNGYDVTASCLASVLAHSNNCRLIVIDDASTDNRIGPLLDRLHAVPERNIKVVILRNERNLGFVQSVNLASEQTKHHFVILNSDTEVPPGWLDRLFAPIFADPDLIASVTPFSNAGMACSFPVLDNENPVYKGLSITELDRFFMRYGSDEPIELFTGVGFCMAFNRLVVQKIGMFDAETFGKGYGEECDWSLRAVDAGFCNVLAPNLFVYHRHGGSFAKEEKERLLAMNLDRFWAKHPNHVSHHASLAAVDAPYDIREAIAALVDLSTATRRVAILDVDMVGGGTLYSSNLADHLQTLGYGVIHFKFNFQSSHLKVIILVREESKTFYLDSSATESTPALLKLFAVDHLIVNELFSWPSPGNVAVQVRVSGISYQVFMHDFFMLCPSWFLIDQVGEFCHLPDDKALCRDCLPKNNFSGHRHAYADTLNDRNQWCSVVASFLSSARQIVCFSSSTKDYLLKAYPQLLQAVVNEHFIPGHELFSWKRRSFDGTGPLRIGIIGNLFYIKGERVVRELTEQSEFHQLPVTLSIFGDAPLFPEGYKTKDGKVSVHGKYRREDLSQLLEKEGIHIVLIASIWPETFSYTTSEAMLMGYPIICFDLGAPAERVSRYGAGIVVSDISANGIIGALREILDTPILVAEMSEKTRQYVPVTAEEHFAGILELRSH